MLDINDVTKESRRILLVEDDNDLREAVEEVLAEAGHTVVSAVDGADGLRRMAECLPDVVVLDLMMPKLDGWQFRIAQRSNPMLAGTPVVVISASNSPTAEAVDADLYLRKPLDAPSLLQAIDGVINARARRLEPAKLAQTERLAALGTLAAGLAHEINNPLTYVLLQLTQATRLLPELATTDRTKLDQVQTLVRGAMDGTERIRGIMTGIRTFSRSDEAGQKLVDIRVPLDAALKLVHNELRHKARLIKTYTDPPLVMANEGRLGQVFLNLLTNAVQAIPEGDAEAHEIRVSTSTNDRGDLVIVISDSGEGIAPHLLSRIFEPYFSTKSVGQGTGLGLSISHSIVTSLGGTISVVSEVGRGTTFQIVLPASGPQRAAC